ncbi:MAG TPA: GNAT family N-acetyltransferase [Thermoplasmata archaeon]|nr:GNAT family N-acetyltransferase [Thermoplasmata archaeon]
MSLSLEPLSPADAHAYWRVFVSGRGDLPTADLTFHLDRYLALPAEEQRTHFAIRKGGRIIGTVRLGPAEISGFSMIPSEAAEATTAVLRCVDFLRSTGASSLSAHFEDRYASSFENLGFRRLFARMRMEGPTARHSPPEGVRLVPPEENEVAGLTKFLMEVYDGHIEQAFGLHAGSEAEWRDYVTGLFKGDSGRFMPDASYVALDEGRLIGAILITDWMAMPLVAELGVAKARRGKGLGRALLAAAMNRLAQRDSPRIALYVTIGNDPAIDLYTSMGFAQIGGQSVTARLEA